MCIRDSSKGLPLKEFTDNNGTMLLLIVMGGLIGGIIWNLFTWLLGLPSSSSHALLGGLVGGTIGAVGFAGVKWAGDGTKLDGVIGKVLLPSLLSPVIAMIVAATATRVIFMVTSREMCIRDRATGEDGDVAEHGLAPVTEAGSLDGDRLEGAPDLVDDQGRQRLAVDVLGNDEQLSLIHI